jgi:hypothetical protein
METVQDTERLCAEERGLSRLLSKEEKCSVEGLKFRGIHAIRAAEAVRENFVFKHKCTSF